MMKKKQTVQAYRFVTHSLVQYQGKLFEEYHGKIGQIVKRSRQKGKNFYLVKFTDTKEFTFQETVLEPVPMEGQISLFSML